MDLVFGKFVAAFIYSQPQVRPGQFIAFVGASGCGKSMMILLFERFYDPVFGRVLCDGTSVPELCPRKYRRDIALLQQEPTLYQGSIRDNIATGVESEVTDARVQSVAKQSNIHDFITSLPEGFATLCGEKGTQHFPAVNFIAVPFHTHSYANPVCFFWTRRRPHLKLSPKRSCKLQSEMRRVAPLQSLSRIT